MMLAVTTALQDRPVVLFSENFEDIGLSRHGWYDLAEGMLRSLTFEEHAPGGDRSLQASFLKGNTTPRPAVGARHLFAESESVYLRYWAKYGDGWVGSGKPYHPHEFYLLTNVDSELVGPSRTHLTVYVEHNYRNGGIAVLGIQDAQNIDITRIGTDAAVFSHRYAVAGCNGDPPGEQGDCHQGKGLYSNGRYWRSAEPVFPRSVSGRSSGWHKVETFFRLNSIRGDQGQRDGIAQYWIDGKLVIDRHDVMFRTSAFPAMKFRQLLFAPYIGDGSPVDQTAWYDDIVVMTGRPIENREEGTGKREE